jgi:hypothetical protein
MMAFLENVFARKSRDAPLNSGRLSSTGIYRKTLSPYRSRSADLLAELRRISDEANAIDFITKKTPDASMALWNFIRMANQGHHMKFYDIRNRQVAISSLEEEWRDFAARVNSLSSQGLDGLIDILHKNAVRYGLQMCEVEVNEDRTDIVDVHPIDPRTVTWEQEERGGKTVWVPYQHGFPEKIDLSNGNVFYVPLDPDSDDPRGTLIMAPALQATDSQLQVFSDVHAVLHHQGYVRDFYQINLERILQMCPQSVKSDPQKLTKWLNEHHEQIVKTLKSIEPDDDIVTYDDVTRNQGQGGGSNVTRSVDFRAIGELTDISVLNGLKQLGTFANRHAGKTETFSTVEMKIFVQGILSLQRGSKRLIEEIARLWLRVKGVQAIPVFTHNVVDWQSEMDKEEVATSKMNRYAIAAIMGWIDNDTAARETMGVKKAAGGIPMENVKVSFTTGGDGSVRNDKRQGAKLQPSIPENSDN